MFVAISEIMKHIEKLEFNEAKDMIGKSLRDDFSELSEMDFDSDPLRVHADPELPLVEAPYL